MVVANLADAERRSLCGISEFWLRRIHSLMGLIPLTFFLCFHLFANSFALESPERFNQVVDFLRSIPHLVIVELSLLGIPFLFHGIYGLYISPNIFRDKLGTFPYVRNFAYLLQRVTGVFVVIFLVAHVWTLRFAEPLDFNVVSAYLSRPVWTVLYFIGISSAVYHLANGLWNFFISWGITVGKSAQKVSAILCALLGLGLWALGMLDLFVFVKPNNQALSKAEKREVIKVEKCDNSKSIGKCDAVKYE